MRGAKRLLASAVVSVACSISVGAQQQPPRLPIKTGLAASGVSGCAAFPPPAQVRATTPNADAESRRLIDAAQDAALQGDHATARDAFVRAATLVPGNARVAYYLGREHESLSDHAAAVREYCRYLALSPSAADGDEVRGRIVRLTPASELARVDEARANFRSGVALLQRRQYLAADSAFASVARQVPAAPEPYFNRALSRAARGDRTEAMQDFERYLELSPQAPDLVQVRGSMARLPDRIYRPGQALGAGILFPGMGQMSTGRPVLGVVALSAVAGAIVVALTSKDELVTERYTDPFGNTYTDSLTRTTRPLAVAGLAGAGVIWLGAAWEAVAYASRSRSRAESIIAQRGSGSAALAVRALPRGRVGVGLRWSLPTVGGSPVLGEDREDGRRDARGDARRDAGRGASGSR